MSEAPQKTGLFGQPDIQPPKCRKSGHAAPPGTGPRGETCRTCEQFVRTQSPSGNKVFLKCNLMRQHWTSGYGTDIRAKDRACWRWVASKITSA